MQWYSDIADIQKHADFLFVFSLDVDECSNGTSACHNNATCNNTIGTYECTCIYGYTGDGFNCTCTFEHNIFLTYLNMRNTYLCSHVG